MRLLLVSSLIIVLLFGGTSVGVSSTPISPKPATQAYPHYVRVLLRPEAAQKLVAPFTEKHTSEPDIQKIALDATDDPTLLLGFPQSLGITWLRPFMPEHSLVFEQYREHLNPSLFRSSNSPVVKTTPEEQLLRTSEEKLSRWFTIGYAGNLTPQEAARLLMRSHNVEFAEPVFARELCTDQYRPNDPLVDSQWALHFMKAFEAWKIVRCDTNRPNHDLDTMLLADVDVGVWLNHPDLVDAIWHNAGEEGYVNDSDKMSNKKDDDSDGYIDDFEGWDFAGYGLSFAGADRSPWNVYYPSHGTHTTGIMAATGNNKLGIAGIAHGAKVIIIKAAVDENKGDFQPPAITFGSEGIVYSTDHHAKVINCSWGGVERSALEQDVINYAYGKNSIVVVSAGNYGVASGYYVQWFPASCDNAFSVTSVNDHNTSPNYPYNERITVAAPGDNILSTVDTFGWGFGNYYGALDGTSMAAPQGSGALGLVWQRFPQYTSRQVMERLRTTCDSIPNCDHPGFRGKGTINIYRAVVDSPAYSLRLDHVDAPNGKSTLVPNVKGTFGLTFRNYLDPLTDAIAVPEILDSMSDQKTPIPSLTGHVWCSQSVLHIPPVGTLASSGVIPLSITADSTIPPQTKVLVRLWISDSAHGYTGDYDYFSVIVNPAFQTLDSNNVLVSFDNKGNVGYVNQTMDEYGEGFVWQNAPAPVDQELGRSILHGGGLIVAHDKVHVVDGLGFYYDLKQTPTTMNPTSIIRESPTSLYRGGQMITGSFSDSLADSSVMVGVNVDEQHFALVTNASKNAIISDYTFTNRGATPFHAGLYLDWDIGEFGAKNSVQFDATDSIMYAWRNEPNYPTIGLKIVSSLSSKSPLTYYAVQNDVDDGYYHLPFDYIAGVESPFPDSVKYEFLTHNLSEHGSGDIAVVLGQRGIDCSAGPKHLTYIYGLGTSQEDVKNTIEYTESLWNGTAGVAQGGSTNAGGIELWPDPAITAVRIRIPGADAMHVHIWDALGRCVLVNSKLGNGELLSVSQLSAGVYTIEVEAADTHLFRTFVKE